ncbi:MAG: redoxin domain-containing protein, partial [Armatimonadota bacterium]|nr:redoxin domain-containing protein [Armatimonadota bacterium]
MVYWTMLIFLLCLCAATLHAQETPEQADPEPLLTVQVLDEAGNPIPNATVGLRAVFGAGGFRAFTSVTEPRWAKTGADGKVVFMPAPGRAQTEGESLEWWLIVSAPNYVPLRESLGFTAKGSTHTVRLKRGRSLEIVISTEASTPLPEPLHLVLFRTPLETTELFAYLDEDAEEEHTGTPDKPRLHSEFGLEALGDGRYRCSIPEDYNQPLLLAVDQPGFLRGFWTLITPAAIQQGRAEVRLPKPCELTIDADTSQAPAESYEGFTVSVFGIVRQGENTPLAYTVLAKPVVGQRVIQIADLAPGNYAILFFGMPKQTGQDPQTQMPVYAAERFSQQQLVSLKPDAPTAVRFAYTPPNPSIYRGDKQFTVTVLMPDGKPAARQPYVLRARDEGGRRITVAEGTLDDEGRATLTQLKEQVPYSLHVANRPESAGYIILGVPDYETPRVLYVPVAVGDRAPDVTLQAVGGEAKKSLRDYKGKWVYIDFWATWCGPCRLALQKLKEEFPKLQARYGDKLAVITISIDDEPTPVKPYLERLGLWGMGEHFWAGEGGGQSRVSRVFGIEGVPTAFLVNPDGVIAWRGHPMELDIHAILAG